ncbi:EXG3_2 [Sanghuangporus sanghuang]
MQITAEQLAAIFSALGLTSSLFKPIPDLVGSLAAPLNPVISSLPLDGVVSAVDGVTHALGLPPLSGLPLIGSILEAKDTSSPVQSPFKSLAVGYRQKIMSTDGSCLVQPYDPPPVLSQTFPPFDQAKATIFRYRQQQAVNLGSWFVHEQWMTQSLFTCASGPKSAEIDIASGWGNTTGARAVLEHHWDTFITQSDFDYLASIGINTVRLPIGYWNLGPTYCQGTPFEPYADVYTNSWSRIVRAINWAGQAGIGVLVDLHGAVGSQNGQAHSGISDCQANFFHNSSNQDATIQVLIFLTQQLASVTNVVGIQVLNEPNNDAGLPDFLNRAIASMRQVSAEASTMPIYIHDGFNLEQYSDFVASRNDFVVEDHHSYFVFGSGDASRSADADTQIVQSSIADQLSSASDKARRNLIIGEWSCALVEAALSGEKDPMQARQQFCQGQEQAYANTTGGWHFWSYMKEGCDNDLDWCFKNAVGNTLPSTFFAYNSSTASSAARSLVFAHAVAEMELPSMTEVLDRSKDQSFSATPAADLRKRSIGAGHQRFFSVHSRRQFLSEISKHKRDGMPSVLAGLTAAEQSMAKGYADGFLTAKLFAQYGMSKLGFKGQYVTDSIAKLGPDVIQPDTATIYSSQFAQGLLDAEKQIDTAASR